MITPRTRAIVSFLATTTTAALALGACAGGPSRPAADGRALVPGAPTVRFDNEGREHVHVYLVGEQREWLLGRVEPGARATLRLPPASLGACPGFVRLAVLAGGRLTAQAALEPRALLTIAQPAAAILAQRWTFGQGQLTPLGPVGAPGGAGGPR